jgi:hypothetical protein
MIKILDYKLKPLAKFERLHISPNVDNYEIEIPENIRTYSRS